MYDSHSTRVEVGDTVHVTVSFTDAMDVEFTGTVDAIGLTGMLEIVDVKSSVSDAINAYTVDAYDPSVRVVVAVTV